MVYVYLYSSGIPVVYLNLEAESGGIQSSRIIIDILRSLLVHI